MNRAMNREMSREMNDALQERIKADMACEFARTGPPEGFPAFPDIPGGRYTSDEFYDLERQHLWPKVWVLAGRAEDAPEPGDYFTFDDLGAPILLVRGADRVLRAFYNTCQHRGAPVVRDAKGSARTLRCQYHSWTYDITSGALVSVPDERDFVGLVKEQRCLNTISCEVWDGWVFVNQDPEARPLQEWFGPAFDELAQLDGPSLRVIGVRTEVIPCNWKVTAEAFMEVYHFRHIHSHKGESALDNRGAAMGLFPNGSARMITPFSRANCEARGMKDWSDWQPFVTKGFPDIASVSAMARSTSTAYSLFPNLITPIASSGFPILMFWPLDIRTTRLDRIHVGIKDWEGPEPSPAWQKRMDLFEIIMEEDSRNMAPMQRSLESPGMHGVPINYQERRIWHFNEQIDRTIGAERIPAALRVPELLNDWVRG